MRGIYSEKGLDNNSLALDLEDSSIVVAPLIPWNIAVAVPMVILSVGVSCIPYAVFLYILPIYRIFFDFPTSRRK
jgi:NhaC family Na+:H+ antiporter